MPPRVTKQEPTKPKGPPKKYTDLMEEMWDLNERESGFTMALYGRSGTGKTRLAVSFPKPLLILGAEDGRKSVKGIPGIVKFLPIKESDKVRESLEMFKSGSIFKTVVLDTASMLQDLILKELLGLESIPTQKSWGLATREQYGQLAIQMKEYLRGLLELAGLGMNVIIIAQERDFNSDSTSDLLTPSIGPGLTPSVTGWLNPACDYVCNTFIRQKMITKVTKVGTKTVTTQVPTKGSEFCLRTAPDPIYMTKFRVAYGKELPELIVNPTYEKIIELV